MGDDLLLARRFGDRMSEALAVLLCQPAQTIIAENTEINALMTDMQSDAKRLRARAIYRGAQSVLDSLDSRAASPVIQGRILALNKLVVQYHAGVQELDALMAVEAAAKTPVVTETMSFEIDETVPLPELPALTEDELFDYQARIRTHLQEVLSFATPTETDALNRLMRYRPEAPRQADAPDRLTTEGRLLEPELRDAIQEALAVARQMGKTISVSYDTEDARIGDLAAKELAENLRTALAALIMQSLPEQGLGHLDLRVDGDVLNISCQGTAPTTVPDVAILAEAEGRIVLSIPLELSGKHLRQKPRKALITDKTESALRAQLAALMDNDTPATTNTIAPTQDATIHNLFDETADLAGAGGL